LRAARHERKVQGRRGIEPSDPFPEADMKHLVLGATGTVGTAVTRELVARNQQVRVLTRDPKKAEHLGPSVEVMQGNLTDTKTLAKLYDGIDGVFVLNALGLEEVAEGMLAVSAARDAKVKRIVYMSVHQIEQAPWLPHFGGKIGVEAAVRASGAQWTILRPNNFYQNDQWYRDALLKYGVYPQPVGKQGISRVDIRDIAELAARALTEDGHGGNTYDLVGPRPLSGDESARLWSEALGKDIKYGGDDLEAWEQQNLAWFPAWLVYDFKRMYAYFQEGNFKATDAEIANLTKALGHPPRKYEDYVRETAAEWTAQGAPTV
jgi:uncharacterized protein YbjT (DUF2867 family)